MYKYKIFNVILTALLFGVIGYGCDDNDKNIYETGHKVVSLVEPENNPVMEVIVDPAKKSNITLQAQIDQLSAYGIVVEVEAKNDLIEAYNKKNGTDYLELSPNSYTLEVSEFIFPKYTQISSHINISITSLGMQNDVKYLLPIQMIQIRGDQNASIDEEGDIMYIIISKLPPPPLIHLKDMELTTQIGPDKKNWFSAYATNSLGGHTFSIEEAAPQSHKMDFALLKDEDISFHHRMAAWRRLSSIYEPVYRRLCQINPY